MEKSPKDPFYTLKYLAYLRTGLTVNDEDLDETSLVNFARWQICKVRNVLWNDPVLLEYTPEELLIEFFAIRFDEDPELRKTFETSLISAKSQEIDWFERMVQKHGAAKSGKIEVAAENLEPGPPVDFEESFK